MAKSIQNPQIYLLLGPEVGEKLNYIHKILHTAQKKWHDVDQYKFYPFDCDMTQIISLMRTQSLFGGARFIVFANFDSFKKADIDQIIAAAKGANDDLYIIICSDLYKVDRHLEELIIPSNKKIFWELKDDQKEAWIGAFFRAEQRSITKEAIERLLELVENNTQELKIACEAIAGFYNHHTPIRAEEIDYLIVHSKEENVFTLFNKLSSKNLEESVEALMKMALSPDGIGVHTITMLAWQFRKLLSLHQGLEQGLTTEEALKIAAITGKKNQTTYKAALHHYSINEIKKILVDSCRYDAAVRGGLNREMIKVSLDSYLFSICYNRQALV